MIATALRLLVCGSAIVLAVFVLDLMNPGWLARLGAGLRSIPDARVDLQQELEFGYRLEKQSQALLVCAVAKRQILMELIDARLTLLEAATRFRDMDRSLHNGRPERLRAVWRSSSEMECYCRHLVQWAEWEFAERPAAATEVLARLRTELEGATESGVFCCLE